ncbi:MAG: glycosyltransferase family 2 protein [Bdellovibrionales bacterium]
MTSAIDICVCTYRRPHVTKTLESIAGLRRPADWLIRVIVADNDDAPSARTPVEDTARRCSLDVAYIHAPARNISVARNACLDAATAPLIAFIDDDETASPDWLTALVEALETNQADAVLGPVNAVYAAHYPGWMRQGDFHSIRPVWVRGSIITGYSGNTLFRCKAVQDLRFRRELGQSGGEDTLFFSELNKRGGKIVYAPDAVVAEAVPRERARLLWLMKRAFRSGQTHGVVLLEFGGDKTLTRIRIIAMECAKIAFCYAAMLPCLMRRDRAVFWLLRGVMHAGVLARTIGKREMRQYG